MLRRRVPALRAQLRQRPQARSRQRAPAAANGWLAAGKIAEPMGSSDSGAFRPKASEPTVRGIPLSVRWRLFYRRRVQVVAVLLFEALVIFIVGRWMVSLPGRDVMTAVYYTLSTVAQTTAALAGFLLAFIALRLPGVREQLEAAVHVREGVTKQGKLVKALAEAMLVRPYTTEEGSIIRRAKQALGASGLTVAVSFFGLAVNPWLDCFQQSWLLVIVLGLTIVTLDLQVAAVWPSLSRMIKESRTKAENILQSAQDTPPER